ncbi:MAG TPA: hypothetical protein VFW75_12025 [Acetobacteraceae bacterium]|nr:hypothetical protein [Acetobacteraceae bacterium]
MTDQQPNGTEAFGGRYRVIRPDESLSQDFCDRYWQRVKDILGQVFQVNDTRADEARMKLGELERRTPQTVFYHADPLEVAADLAGRRDRAITPEEKERYQQLLGEVDRPPPSHLAATHPED